MFNINIPNNNIEYITDIKIIYNITTKIKGINNI